MNPPQLLPDAARLLAVLAFAAVIVTAGRYAARRTRQPAVIGEITAGLLAGPLALWALGPHRFAQALPAHLLTDLKLVAQTGLVLYIVSMVHDLRLARTRPSARSTGWVVAGAFVPALAAGVLLALWVVLDDDPALRGTAPTPAFVLFVAVALSITAVPVLARILTDRAMNDSASGQVALAAALVIDSVSWLALTAAAALQAGRSDGLLRPAEAVVGGVLAALLLRRLLGLSGPSRLAEKRPLPTAVLVALLAAGFSYGITQAGMTAVLGAVLAALALPVGPEGGWDAAVGHVGRVGRVLLPVFFVVSGITVLTKGFSRTPVTAVVLAVVLGALGKVVGGYLGARTGGLTLPDSLRVGALMNTRGLTELVALQVGYSAGILTAPLYLALVVMALSTTAMTGPALQLIDRLQLRHRLLPRVPLVYAESEAK